MGLSVRPLRRQFARQLRPQVLDQLTHRLGDGFDAFEVENFLVDALDLSRVDDPAIEDARFVTRFLFSHCDLPMV